jgi:hypothetical protein
VLLFLSSFPGSAYATSHGGCRFEYTHAIQTDVIVPILQDKFSIDYQFYNFEQPFVEEKKSSVELSFVPTKVIDGRRLMSERDFVIELDRCSSKVIRTYEEQY